MRLHEALHELARLSQAAKGVDWHMGYHSNKMARTDIHKGEAFVHIQRKDDLE